MTAVEITDQQRWDAVVGALPGGHPLQLWAWGEVKRLNGWTPHRLALLRVSFLVVTTTLALYVGLRSVGALDRVGVGVLEFSTMLLTLLDTWRRLQTPG